MSDRHAATPPFAMEIAPEIGAVPASVEAFQAALKAERDNVLAELQASLQEQNEAYRHALTLGAAIRVRKETARRHCCWRGRRARGGRRRGGATDPRTMAPGPAQGVWPQQ